MPKGRPGGNPDLARIAASKEPFWKEGRTIDEAFQLMVNQIVAYLSRPHLDQTFRLRLFRIVSTWKVSGEDAKNDLAELKKLLQDVRKVA